MPLTATQHAALVNAAKNAAECERATGFPASVSVGQWALESGWGKAMPGNNCFGIKAVFGDASRQLLPTTEWFTDQQLKVFLMVAGRVVAVQNGTTLWLEKADDSQRMKARGRGPDAQGRYEYHVKDWFRSFLTLKDAFTYHATMLMGGRYKAAWDRHVGDKDDAALIKGIAKAGYATVGQYDVEVTKIMRMGDVMTALAVARQVA